MIEGKRGKEKRGGDCWRLVRERERESGGEEGMKVPPKNARDLSEKSSKTRSGRTEVTDMWDLFLSWSTVCEERPSRTEWRVDKR